MTTHGLLNISDTHVYEVEVGCPDTFGPIGGSGCYFPVISGKRMTWAEAQDTCQNLNCRADSLRLETNQVKIGIF